MTSDWSWLLGISLYRYEEGRLMSQAGAGLLYLLSCLAKFGDMRAEMEAAGAVDVLLELLSTCHDTKVQVDQPSSPAPDNSPLPHEATVCFGIWQGCSAGH